MGSQFAEQCVQIFLDVFSREALARNMLEEGTESLEGRSGGRSGRGVVGSMSELSLVAVRRILNFTHGPSTNRCGMGEGSPTSRYVSRQ